MKKELIEDALLSNKSLDELIKLKMKEEIKTLFKKKSNSLEKTKIYNIKDVPRNVIFSKNAIFKKFNRTNNTISFINGIQAESLLGLDDNSREKLLKGDIEVFSTENAYIKFEYVEIISRN